ncbi:MAG: hypothetical protein K9M54_11845, partial [Kiritimatiellales bacterium]|nr:hypothetical protein [Kiritimatiellales bacterium]
MAGTVGPMGRISLILGILFRVAMGHAEEDLSTRYQLIIERHPFGKDANLSLDGESADEGAGQVLPAAQSFARTLRLCMLLESSDGEIRAGIIDSKDNKSCILGLGEIGKGVELVGIDLDESEAKLRKGKEIALLKLAGVAPAIAAQDSPASSPSSYAERRRALLQKNEERRQQNSTPPAP